MRSRRMPWELLGSLGERNVATAEWNTEILLLKGPMLSGSMPS